MLGIICFIAIFYFIIKSLNENDDSYISEEELMNHKNWVKRTKIGAYLFD